MNFVTGIILAVISAVIALEHLQQSVLQFFDIVALSIVFGGTLAVSTIILPWKDYRNILKNVSRLFFYIGYNKRDIVNLGLVSLNNYKRGEKIQVPNDSPFHILLLKDGFELLQLGLQAQKVEAILSERIHHYYESNKKVADAIRSLAKYPPAFGLTGTVFGLVELMKSVSQGMPAKETGLKMAIALVATLYGLVIANLFLNPAGEQILKCLKSDKALADISLQVIMLAAQNVSMLESQELLNSMVDQHERVDFVSQQYLEAV
ncbi:MAG: MotA/TolQ/ExbB proton channel family protein [Bdellovibrionaceae bacterium]|nr:MotA/TolQ/ExbB proton channel family protein [Pseudobdellovibrionaceae bacterium]